MTLIKLQPETALHHVASNKCGTLMAIFLILKSLKNL